jgi:CheY-like chemotaxis protein
LKILLIDDSLIQRKIARLYLEKGEGHFMVTADSGNQGIEAARTGHPELIILDGETEGMATLKKLKSDAATRDIPVVICMSGDGFDEESAALNGAAGLIRKSYGLSSLKNIKILSRMV